MELLAFLSVFWDGGGGIIKLKEEQTEICYNKTQNTAKEDEGIAVGRK